MNHPDINNAGQLRTDLEIVRQERDGRTRFVVRDPAGSMFLLSGFSYELLSRLDGRGLGEALSRITGLATPPPDLLAAAADVVRRARQAGLMTGGRPEAPETSRWRIAAAARWNPLFIQLRLVNPEPLTRLLRPVSRLVFSTAAVGFWMAAVAAVAVLVAIHWPQYRISFKIFRFFRWWTVVYAVLFVTTLLHEVGHVLACDRFSVAVKRAGLLLCFLLPAAFADVSGAWLLHRRRDRIAVSLAGVYVEAILWSAATLVWWTAVPWSVPAQIGFVLSVCTAGRIAVNLVPFLRLDGYWVLADLLDVPGLRRKSFEYLASLLPAIGYWWRPARMQTAREKLILASYGIAAMVTGPYVLYRTGRSLHALLVRLWQGPGVVVFWSIAAALACAVALNLYFHLARARAEAAKTLGVRNLSPSGS